MSEPRPVSTLDEFFDRTADRYPQAPAVEIGTTVVSYERLRRCAVVLAERITRQCGPAPRRVALLANRSLVAVAGYLAVLRLGATVVPLNPGFPATRNETACELAGVDLVLADTATGWSGAGCEVLRVDDAELLADEREVRLPPPHHDGNGDGGGDGDGDGDGIAYILFTSGSTGRPKGVPIRHRNAVRYVAHNIARFEVRPGCRMSHTFDLTFDPSVFDLFVTWGAGATLVVPGATDLLTPVEYVAANRITHWFSVPSVVSVADELGNLPRGQAPGLRYGIFIGEQLSYRQARLWHEVAPNAVIANVYGPTELTVACTEYRLDADPRNWPATSNDTVPIGPVYEFLDHVVLDEHGAPAQEGELCVRGAQRFDGYLDPADNAGRFWAPQAAGHGTDGTDGAVAVTDAHFYRTGDRVRRVAGGLVHLGRLDNQVKVRGYRVELGEIETALRRHPQLREAVVLAVRPDADSQVELVGCYTGADLEPRELVRWLRRRLPLHMVPRRFHHLDALPLNPNGKTDRAALVDLVRSTSVAGG